MDDGMSKHIQPRIMLEVIFLLREVGNQVSTNNSQHMQGTETMTQSLVFTKLHLKLIV